MLVTTLVSMSALLVSYREVQISAGEMRDRGAPAVQGVAATQLALLRAHKEAQASVDSGIADVVGAGARYENQLAAADQGLSRLSDVQIDGDRGRGVLETVNGLLTSYSSSITPGAVKYVSDEPMQRRSSPRPRPSSPAGAPVWCRVWTSSRDTRWTGSTRSPR